jgi:hypothetical protein
MATRILPGYDMPLGSKIEMIIDRDGPASYTGGTSGTDIINASDLGIGGFETVDCTGLSNDGTTSAVATLINMSTSNDNIGNAVPTARIRYFVVATAAEVANAVNLSGKSFRFQIRGV